MKATKEDVETLAHKLQRHFEAECVLLMVVERTGEETEVSFQNAAKICVASTVHMTAMLPKVLRSLASDITSRNIENGVPEVEMSKIHTDLSD